MTQDEFLCAKNLTREPAPNADATSAKLMGATILDESKIKSFGLYLVLRTCGDFRIIRLNDTDTGLIDRNSDLVGYYIDEGLRIDCGPARRQDLSVALGHDRRLGHLYQRPPKLVLSNALKKATHG